MKLLKTILNLSTSKKSRGKRNDHEDYYQRNLNSFGKNQMQTLVKKGISLSW